MKIVRYAYPESSKPVDLARVKFIYGAEISRVMQSRMAYYAAFYGTTFNGYGYKDLVKQTALYLAWQSGKGNPAAKPGESRHNYACAYDQESNGTGVYPATMMADYKLAPEKQTLAKFGLFLPFWEGHASLHEPWHLQPIETFGVTNAQFETFLDFDDLVNTGSGHRLLEYRPISGYSPTPTYKGADVKVVQKVVGAVEDGVFGPNTAKAVAAWRARNGLPNTGTYGIVDDTMWLAVLKFLAPPDYKALYEACSKDLELTKTDYLALAAVSAKQKEDLDRAEAKLSAIRAALG